MKIRANLFFLPAFPDWVGSGALHIRRQHI
jgi:hypothetical protein